MADEFSRYEMTGLEIRNNRTDDLNLNLNPGAEPRDFCSPLPMCIYKTKKTYLSLTDRA